MQASCVLLLFLASNVRLCSATALRATQTSERDFLPTKTRRTISSRGAIQQSCGLPEQYAPMDYVVLAEKSDCVLQSVISSLQAYASPRRVLIIAANGTCAESNFNQLASKVQCIDENVILPGITKETTQGWLRDLLGHTVDDLRVGLGSHTMADWYLQQFLKMGVADDHASQKLNLSENYVLWDSDMVLLRDFCPFNVKGQVNLMEGDSGPENKCNKVYQKSYTKLTGYPYEYSHSNMKDFTTHHMVVNQAVMRAFLSRIGTSIKKHWTTAILEASCTDLETCSCGFSEYGSYASWMKRAYPDQVVEVPLQYERNPHVADANVSCCPDHYPEYFKRKTREGLLFVSFERSCTKSKNYIEIDQHPHRLVLRLS